MSACGTKARATLLGCGLMLASLRAADTALEDNARGLSEEKQGRIDAALADFGSAIRLRPDDPNLYYNRGMARHTEGDQSGAQADFDRARKLDVGDTQGYAHLGAENVQGAEAQIIQDSQALEIDPQSAELYQNRGQAKTTKGDSAGAMADYARAIRLDPAHAADIREERDEAEAYLYVDRARDNGDAGKFRQAESNCARALKLDGKNFKAHRELGIVEAGRSDWRSAIAEWRLGSDDTSATKDHGLLWIWLAEAQLDPAAPHSDLLAYLEDRKVHHDWTEMIGGFLLGRVKEADFVGAPDYETGSGTYQKQQCDAWYYAGMKRLLAGDRMKALDYFHRCVATGQSDEDEYQLAVGELSRMEGKQARPD